MPTAPGAYGVGRPHPAFGRQSAARACRIQLRLNNEAPPHADPGLELAVAIPVAGVHPARVADPRRRSQTLSASAGSSLLMKPFHRFTQQVGAGLLAMFVQELGRVDTSRFRWAQLRPAPRVRESWRLAACTRPPVTTRRKGREPHATTRRRHRAGLPHPAQPQRTAATPASRTGGRRNRAPARGRAGAARSTATKEPRVAPRWADLHEAAVGGPAG